MARSLVSDRMVCSCARSCSTAMTVAPRLAYSGSLVPVKLTFCPSASDQSSPASGTSPTNRSSITRSTVSFAYFSRMLRVPPSNSLTVSSWTVMTHASSFATGVSGASVSEMKLRPLPRMVCATPSALNSMALPASWPVRQRLKRTRKRVGVMTFQTVPLTAFLPRSSSMRNSSRVRPRRVCAVPVWPAAG